MEENGESLGARRRSKRGLTEFRIADDDDAETPFGARHSLDITGAMMVGALSESLTRTQNLGDDSSSSGVEDDAAPNDVNGSNSRSTAKKAASRFLRMVKTDLELEADETVTMLGFGLKGVPPLCVTVARLETGGWAQEHGVKRRDQLRKINGRFTSTFQSKDQIIKVLQERPLTLTFQHQAATGFFDVWADLRLMVEESEADKKHRIATTRAALKVGAAKAALEDVVQHVVLAEALRNQENMDGNVGSEVLESIAAVEGLQQAVSNKELKSCLRRVGDKNGYFAFTVHAEEGVESLGFTLSKVNHIILSERSEGWAIHHELKVGDILLMVEDQDVLGMSHHDLAPLMRKRPVALTFRRQVPATTIKVETHLGLAQMYEAAGTMANALVVRPEEGERKRTDTTDSTAVTEEESKEGAFSFDIFGALSPSKGLGSMGLGGFFGA